MDGSFYTVQEFEWLNSVFGVHGVRVECVCFVVPMSVHVSLYYVLVLCIIIVTVNNFILCLMIYCFIFLLYLLTCYQ
jgi:hypothetical protein